MRTVIYETEPIFAHKKLATDKDVLGIVVDADGKQVSVVFDKNEEDRVFDYYDYLNLPLYEPKEEK